MRQVIFELKRLQRRAHFMLMAQRLSVLLAGIGGMTLVLVGLDYLLRLPGTARLLLLGSALAALGYAFSVYLRPAFRFRPGLTELALRAEEIFPAMAGHLASSVEFAESGLDRTNPLAARSVKETLSRLAGESLPSMMSPRRSVRDGAVLLAVAARRLQLRALQDVGHAQAVPERRVRVTLTRSRLADKLLEVCLGDQVHGLLEGQPRLVRKRQRRLAPFQHLVGIHFRASGER